MQKHHTTSPMNVTVVMPISLPAARARMQERRSRDFQAQSNPRRTGCDLASRAFTPSAARAEPLIHGCATEKVKTSPDKITTQNIDEKKPPPETTKEATCSAEDSGQLAPTALWMFVSQTRIRSPAASGPRSKCWRHRKKRRNGNISGPAWKIAVISHLS